MMKQLVSYSNSITFPGQFLTLNLSSQFITSLTSLLLLLFVLFFIQGA